MVSYSFDSAYLINGIEMVSICSVCLQEGHKAISCPCEKLPKLVQLSKLNNDYVEMYQDMFARIT